MATCLEYLKYLNQVEGGKKDVHNDDDHHDVFCVSNKVFWKLLILVA